MTQAKREMDEWLEKLGIEIRKMCGMDVRLQLVHLLVRIMFIIWMLNKVTIRMNIFFAVLL